MPDPITIAAALFGGVGAGTVSLYVYRGCRSLWYKVRFKIDTARMRRNELQYSQDQASKQVYEAVIAELRAKVTDLEDEVYHLTRRNILITNELRSDPKALTEVLPQSSGRFAKGL